MKERIANACRLLKIGSNIVETYPTIDAETHDEFLARLLEMELEYRDLNRKNLYLKQANFDVVKTFQDYVFDQVDIPGSISVEEIKDAAIIEKKENLILYRPVGTGKTHLATAIALQLLTGERR